MSAGLVLALWLTLMRLPLPPRVDLDPSWQEVLVRAQAENWQFGRDLVFTFGPWGFLFSNHHLGHAGANLRLAWECIGQLGLALAMVRLMGPLAAWRRIACVGAMAGLHGLSPDAAYVVAILLIVSRGMMLATNPALGCGSAAMALGFLAQVKFTYTVAIFAGVAAATALALARRRWQNAAAISGGSALAFLVWWKLAGQSWSNLPAFFAAGFDTLRGYDAMASDEAAGVLTIGAALALWCGVFLARLWRHAPHFLERVATAGFLGVLWFMTWKHAYTRADQLHVSNFFVFTLYLATIAPGLYFGAARFERFDLTWIFCAAVLAVGDFGTAAAIRAVPAHWITNVSALANLRELPSAWQRELETVQRAAGLSELPAQVGAATIDVYNFNQGKVLISPLNYRPRPVFQSYYAYTPRFAALNEAHVAAHGAEFFLWRQKTIDDRFPTQDDSRLFPLVKRLYRPVSAMSDYVLLRRTATDTFSRDAGVGAVLLKRRIRLGETCQIPASAVAEQLWLKVTARPSLLGRLRAFVFKPAALFIITEDARRGQRPWRLVPRIAASPGFLLQPILETTGDFAAYLNDADFPPVRFFGFETPEGQHKFWDELEIELVVTPRALPSQP